VRPTCVASLVAADNDEQFRKAAKINTCLWGGALNPILLYSPKREQECIWQLETFDPDYVHAFTDIPDEAAIRGHMREWPSWPSALFSETEGRMVMQFCDVAPIIRGRSERVQGTPFALLTWPDDAKAGTLYCATLGTYPENTSPNYTELCRRLLDVMSAELTGGPPEDYLPPPYLTPIRLTLEGIRTQAPRRVLGPGGLFLGKPDSLEDMADFWNLRAVGYHNLCFVPMGVAGAVEAFAEIAEAGSVRSVVQIHVGRSTTLEEAKEAVAKLPGMQEAFTVMFAPMSPGRWHDQNLQGRRCWSPEATEVALLEGWHVTFRGLAPEFLDPPYTPKFWTREVTIRRPFGEERLLGSFPALPSLQRHAGRWAMAGERGRIDTPAIVTHQDHPHETASIALQSVAEIVDHVLSDQGLTVATSQPGRTCEALAERLGGIEGCRMLKLRAVREAIDQLAAGKPVHSDCLRATINRALSEAPADKHVGYAAGIIGPDIEVDAVLDWLVRHRVMRPGLKLECRGCGDTSWYSLSHLGDTYTCEACYEEQPTPRPDGLRWHYVADGFFRSRGKAHGAVPVLLTIWRLMFPQFHDETAYAPSFDVKSPDEEFEVDIALIAVNGFKREYRLLFGEVIGADGQGAEDIAKLKLFAERVPEAYLCVSTTAAEFAPGEHAALADLRASCSRLIVMTRGELEPYGFDDLEEGLEEGPNGKRFIFSWDDLCIATQRKYFPDQDNSDPPSCQQ
jgi:hypothetical protein